MDENAMGTFLAPSPTLFLSFLFDMQYRLFRQEEQYYVGWQLRRTSTMRGRGLADCDSDKGRRGEGSNNPKTLWTSYMNSP